MALNGTLGPNGWEMDEIQSPVSGGGVAWEVIPYALEIPLDGQKWMSDAVLSASSAFAISGTPVAGGSCKLGLIADGVSSPTFTGINADPNGDAYNTTNNRLNNVIVWYDGIRPWVTIRDTGLTASVVASALTLSGPSAGVVGVASSNFTIAANGTISGSVVVAPNDSSAGGTFTPTTRTLTSGAPTATFTYTPASTGSKSVSITNGAGLTNPSAVSMSVSAAATAPDQVINLVLGTATASTQPLSWSAPGNGGSALTDYVVQYALAGSGSWTTFSDGTSTTTSTTVTGLTTATSYDYRVAAVNAVGQGAYSTIGTGSTAAVSFVRLSTLGTGATETGAGPYTYVGASSGSYAATPNLSLASGATGEFQAAINAMPASFCGAGFGMTPLTDTNGTGSGTGNVGIFSSFKYLLYANTNLTGTGTYLFGLNGAAGGALNGTAVIPAAGDIIRMERAGTNLTVQVARAATPTTFTTVHTIVGSATTAQLYPRCIMNANGNSMTMTSQVGLT